MSGGPVLLAHDVHAPEHEQAVVLLHSLALDRRVWRDMIGPLSRTRAVVALDLRGHGQSPRDDAFTVEDMADDVARTLDEIGLDSVTAIGMSMGGCVAQALAVRHPGQVEALGLVDTTAWYGEDAPRAWAERADKAQQDGLASLAEFQLTRWFTDGFRQQHQDVCRELLEVFAANEVASYAAACRALGSADLREGVSGLDLPAVIVVGEHDAATPPADARDLHERLPGSHLHIVSETKHLTAVERPDEVLAQLSRLLD